jgi:hypothetical protein
MTATALDDYVEWCRLAAPGAATQGISQCAATRVVCGWQERRCGIWRIMRGHGTGLVLMVRSVCISDDQLPFVAYNVLVA